MCKQKKAIILMITLLIIMVIAGGCKSKLKHQKTKQQTKQGATSQSGNGRFFESELPLPEGIQTIQSLRQLSDGSLEAVGSSDNDKSYSILNSKDLGQNWKQTKLSGLQQEYIPHTAIAPDGKVALIHYANKGKIDLSIADTDGKTNTIVLEFPGNQNTNTQVLNAAYSAEGTLFIQTQDSSLYSVDPNGKCSKTCDTQGIHVNYFNITGNTLLAITDDTILLFDAKSGKQLPEENSLNDLIRKNKELASCGTDVGYPMVFSAGTEENTLFFANKNGIFHFTSGGNVIEQLMDGSLTSLNSGSSIFYDMVVADPSNIFINADNGREHKLYHYTYDEKAASTPNQELSVYALDESIYLRNVISLFQKQYPDIRVNLEIGLSGKDGVTLEDALSVLNTNILAGKGPDVLILDGMPTDRYIEKGVLEDISDVVKEVDQKDGLFPNIVNASKEKDAIYAIPSRLLIPVFEGNQDLRASSGTLESLAQKVTELQKQSSSSTVNTSPLKGPKLLLLDLYYADSATWKDKEGSIDAEALSNYLRYAKQIYDSDKHDSKEEDHIDSSTGNSTLETGEKIGTHRYNGLLSGEWQYSYGTLSDIFGLQTICSSRKKSKTDYCLLNRDRVKSYIPYLTAGVMKKGNTEAGKNFVKLLLGKQAENSQSNGIPVNRAAFEALCHEKLDDPNVKDGLSMIFSSQDSDKTYDFDYVNLTQKDIDIFTDIVESLEQSAMTDRVIQEIVLEQGKQYLQGKQDLEETVDAILKKVNLYLNE